MYIGCLSLLSGALAIVQQCTALACEGRSEGASGRSAERLIGYTDADCQ